MGKRKTGERKKELLDKEAGHTAAHWHYTVMRACGDGVFGVDPIGCCDPSENVACRWLGIGTKVGLIEMVLHVANLVTLHQRY